MSEYNDTLPRLCAEIESGIERGWHRGVQVSVSYQGQEFDRAIGTSHDGVPLTSDTLLPWLSAGKPLTAVAILRLTGTDKFDLQAPIVEVIPEFAATSEVVTTFHLLTHTAGLAAVSTGWPQRPWEEIIQGICDGGLIDGWVPGERAGYDPQRSWFLLGEIVRRLDGRPIEQVVREDIMIPLGMHDSWMAMSPEQHQQYGDRIGRTYLVEGSEEELTGGHTETYCTTPAPGASCRGPIRELRLFYSSPGKWFDDKLLPWMTHPHRKGMYDETFQHTLDFGLGVILNSSRYGRDTVPYGYGTTATEVAFGHGGARSCIAFADYPRNLVVCIVANGYPSEPQHQRRMRRLLAVLEEDLQLDDN